MPENELNKSCDVAIVAPRYGFGIRLLKGALGQFKEQNIRSVAVINSHLDTVEYELKRWSPRVVLAAGASSVVQRYVSDSGGTVIQLPGADLDGAVATFTIDDLAVGADAAKFFLGRGFKSFAFYGIEGFEFSEARLKGFSKAIKKQRRKVDVYLYSREEIELAPKKPDAAVKRHYELRKWLKQLPKNTALFCDNDEAALEVNQIAAHEGIAIPDHLALVGVDDDPFICRCVEPQLSSLLIPFEKMGGDAALEAQKHLGKSIQGKRNASFVYESLGVSCRGSTDTMPIQDEYVRQAIDYMKAHSDSPIKIQDILAELGVSRNFLEKRFKEEMDCTPLDALRRRRIEVARSLLADTDLPIKEVARQSGFSSNIRFANVFADLHGMSAQQYRDEMVKHREI